MNSEASLWIIAHFIITSAQKNSRVVQTVISHDVSGHNLTFQGVVIFFHLSMNKDVWDEVSLCSWGWPLNHHSPTYWDYSLAAPSLALQTVWAVITLFLTSKCNLRGLWPMLTNYGNTEVKYGFKHQTEGLPKYKRFFVPSANHSHLQCITSLFPSLPLSPSLSFPPNSSLPLWLSFLFPSFWGSVTFKTPQFSELIH